jgi:phosphate transport system substrate-binding protein
MSDEFLYRLRKDPRPEFSARLKAKLDLQPQPSQFAVHSSWIRSLIMILLVGGSALAGVWLVTEDSPRSIFQVFNAGEIPAPRASTPASAPASGAGQRFAKRSADAASANPESRSDPFSSQSDVAASSQADSTPQFEHVGFTILSSSTTSALANMVAEAIGKNFPKPQIVPAGGTRVMQTFCGGIGNPSPHAAIATNRITPEEFAACRHGRISRMVEAQLGYQAVIVTAGRNGPSLKLTPRDLYLALAKQIPDPSDSAKLIDNPNLTWDQVNPKLRPWRIEVLGPRLNSVAREALNGLVLEAGCDTFAWIEALKTVDENRYRRICHTLRNDAAYIQAAQPETSTVQALLATPDSLGIVDYGVYERNRHLLAGSLMEGIDPTLESIASGAYKPSRPLYFYLNAVNVLTTPGAWQVVHQVLNEASLGPAGYLTREGLVPLTEAQRQAMRANVQQFNELNL